MATATATPTTATAAAGSVELPRKELSRVVGALCKLAKRNPKRRPILRTILATSDEREGLIRFRATDLDTHAFADFPASIRSGTWVCNLDLLSAALKSNKDKSARVVVTSTSLAVDGVKVSTDDGVWEWPGAPKEVPSYECHESNALGPALKRALLSASKEPGRYAIHGIHFTRSGIESTDGRRLYAECGLFAAEGEPEVAPRDAVECALSLAGSGPMAYHRGILRWSGWSVQYRPVECVFPDTAELRAKAPTDWHPVKSAVIAEAAERARKILGKRECQSVSVRLWNFGADFAAKADGQSIATWNAPDVTDVPIEEQTPETHYHPAYLRDACAQMDGDAEIALPPDSSRAAWIRQGNRFAVVMPVTVS